MKRAGVVMVAAGAIACVLQTLDVAAQVTRADYDRALATP